MGRMLEVRCKHLEGELLRVRFAASQLVSDHPFSMGGTQTGPSPGEMMMMGIASASALAGGRFADENGLAAGHLGARSSMTMHSEGFPGTLNGGPLLRRSYVGRFWRRLEGEGRFGASEAEGLLAAMANTTVANTLLAGAGIDERLEFHRTSKRAPLALKNPFHTVPERTARLAEGEMQVTVAPDNWRVSAAALDRDTCLLKAVRSLWVVGRDVDQNKGPTPEELLLAALAACTTIYVARNSALREIPVETVEVTVRAQLPDNPGEPIARFEKVCEVSGDLTAAEVADVGHMAYYCALGETIKRGAPFHDESAFEASSGEGLAVAGVQALDRNAPRPADPTYCDDGSCCLPT